MGGITMAWLIGEGLVFWRWSRAGAPPTPGALALSSGFFALAAVLATYPPARGAATALAFGMDIAALLQVLPGSKQPRDQNWPPSLIENSTFVVLPPGTTTTPTGAVVGNQ